MKNNKTPYGFELIMDLHDCDVSKFNRENLKNYFIKVCKAIDMVRCELYFWDDIGVPIEDRQTSPHTKGTSAVQFILTSTIVVHTLDQLKSVYINVKCPRVWRNAFPYHTRGQHNPSVIVNPLAQRSTHI